MAGGATAMEDSVERRRASASAATLHEATSLVTAEVGASGRVDAPADEPFLPLQHRLDALREIVHSVAETAACDPDNAPPASLERSAETLLGDLQEMLRDAERQFVEARDRSDALANAQADAIIRSVEIIDELEETKQQLSEARRMAEESARDTQSLADMIFARTSDAILVLKNRECIACNDKVAKLLGMPRDKVIGSFPSLFAPVETIVTEITPATATANDKPGVMGLGECPATQRRRKPHDPYDAALRHGLWSFESYRAGPKGDDAWFEVTLTSFPMRGETHVLAVVRDITSRKRFEQELQRNRDFLHNVINAVRDQLIVQGQNQRLLLVNNAFCDAHQVQRNEAMRRTAADFAPPHEADLLRQSLDRIFDDGLPQDAEEQALDERGLPQLMAVKRSLFRDPVTGDAFVVSTSRDITDERRNEERLRLLATVFNNAQEGVAILDDQGFVVEANPVFLEIAGGSDENLLVRRLDHVLDWSFADFPEVIEAVSAGQPWAGRVSLMRKSEQRSYWVSFSPATDRTGQATSHIIVMFSDVTDIVKSQKRLRRRAMFDNVTGLPNRRYFRERLKAMIQDPQHQDPGFAILFLDLDDFKHVNDSQGHAAGDQLLRQVARRLRKCTGPGGFVARFGGDEFAILLPNADAAHRHVSEIADTIHGEIRKAIHLDHNEAYVSVSIGATHYPSHSQDVDTLLRNADVAMYAAKDAGKNQLRLFSAEMRTSVEVRHQLHGELRRALRGDELKLAYQPKVWAASGKLAGCEALARWQKPCGTNVSPGEFVPVAEKTGLIIALGNRVLRNACQQAKHWRELGLEVPHVAVNISPNQMREPRFIERVERILEETGVDPHWLELEITENAVMDNVDQAVKIIDRLGGMGISLAIDDFGTGHSSLSYLKSFNIDTLKIDASFVRDLPDDETAVAIVRSIISLGKGCGLTVVAEGVETDDQLNLLLEVGCDVIQGYYFSRPLWAEQFQDWAARRAESTADSLVATS